MALAAPRCRHKAGGAASNHSQPLNGTHTEVVVGVSVAAGSSGHGANATRPGGCGGAWFDASSDLISFAETPARRAPASLSPLRPAREGPSAAHLAGPSIHPLIQQAGKPMLGPLPVVPAWLARESAARTDVHHLPPTATALAAAILVARAYLHREGRVHKAEVDPHAPLNSSKGVLRAPRSVQMVRDGALPRGALSLLEPLRPVPALLPNYSPGGIKGFLDLGALLACGCCGQSANDLAAKGIIGKLQCCCSVIWCCHKDCICPIPESTCMTCLWGCCAAGGCLPLCPWLWKH